MKTDHALIPIVYRAPAAASPRMGVPLVAVPLVGSGCPFVELGKLLVAEAARLEAARRA